MIQDGLGSVRAVVDGSFDVDESRHYAPYGEPWGVQGSSQTNFGFTGEPTDGNGLVHLRARYLNPSLGVFPSLDPVEGALQQAMSLNRYGYVAGNVVNAVDPSGMIGETPKQWDSCRQQSDPCDRSFYDIVASGDYDLIYRCCFISCSSQTNRDGTRIWTDQYCQTGCSQLADYWVSRGQSPAATSTPTSTPSGPSTPTLPVQTIRPPASNFVTPTPVPGARDAYYCYDGAYIPPNLTCLNTDLDTQEEILAHALLTESQGSLDPETMANVAQVIWNRRGADLVGNALNPATIVQRSAASGVSSVRHVAFAGILQAVDRNSPEWDIALGYANVLMQAHNEWVACNGNAACQSNVSLNYGTLTPPDPRLGSLTYYCAVDEIALGTLDTSGILVFYEETSPGTFHAYTTDDCSIALD